MINKKNIIILFSLITVILFFIIICIQGSEKYFKEKKVEQVSVEKKQKEKIKKTTQMSKKENVVIFGDSITEFYPVEDIFDNYQIIGSGVSGYTTVDLLNRMVDMLYKYNPTKVILLIGTNDIMTDVSEKQQKETAKNIIRISEDIKQYRPNAKIYIESIYPVNRDLDKEMVNKRTNEAIQNINKEVKEYCTRENISYVNMYDKLTDSEGNFDKKYTNDGLHPNNLGYARISQVLMKYIYNI